MTMRFLSMAEQLGECSAIFSGSEGTLPAQTPGSSCHVEETVVRDAAVAAACKVIDALPDSAAAAVPTEMVMRLATGDCHQEGLSMRFACHSLWQSLAGGQVELLNTYVASLCADDAPMVRRAAAASRPCGRKGRHQ